ncbi:MAG: hypothetical protein CL908_26660 [Deltaproteobacteria bacterium]|nr:hypothetical protein [Deltaproteobacteria bacterium]
MPTSPSKPPSLQASKSDPGLLWDEFCDALKEAGSVLRRAETPRDALTISEGYRHLLRMVRIGFENHFELADLERPALTPMVGRMVQYEGITSDARYLHGFIDGRATHRISGFRGGAPLIEFGVYTGKMGMHDPSHLISSITEEGLEVTDDGRVEVILGPEEHRGNWIHTDEQTRYVMIRQYAPEWSDLAPGRFEIERIAPSESAPGDASRDLLDGIRKGLENTAAFATGTPRIWAEISDYWKEFAVNRFVPQIDADRATDIAPPSGHLFSCGYFEITPDDMLVVSFRPGEAGFWSLGLATYWYETIGYGRRESHLNSGTVVAEPDGEIRVAISLEPPPASSGIRNWIDPKGHREGTMVFRWSRPKDPMPDIACEQIPRNSLS